MADDDRTAADAAMRAARYMQAKYAATYGVSMSSGGGAGGSGGNGSPFAAGGGVAITGGGAGYSAGGGGGSGGSTAFGSVISGGGGASVGSASRQPDPVPQVVTPIPGMDGFSEDGPGNFAAGTLAGYRWWSMPGPDFHLDPLTADEHWPRALLSGQRGEWQPGVNEAVCLQGHPHTEPVPAGGCGDGFHAYKTLARYNLDAVADLLAVAGVIEGWGRSRTGSLGFRCAKARIVALCPQRRTRARRYQPGWYDVFDSGYAEAFPPEDVPRIETWMAVIECRLEETYPEARIFTSRDAMLAKFPLRS